MDAIVYFYYLRVIKKNKKWTDVPKMWNKKVQEQLIADGYVLNEDGTVSKED